ncbi:MAG: NTP transferase domain-containing protein [Vulcanimicrobiaceae bacterium]|jgi:molybdenum cofactor cytidylyltransferase
MDGVRAVVLAGGSSQRMGFHKLVAPFDGVPLARRLALALRELWPTFVATPEVVETIADLQFVQLILTQPTAGPSVSLGLANAAVPDVSSLAVLPADVPFLDAARVRAFVARVPDDADLAYPLVNGTPGHPVVWSPKARARIPGLAQDEPPSSVRRDPALHVVALVEDDEAYVTDVDTPEAWRAAELAARQARAAKG